MLLLSKPLHQRAGAGGARAGSAPFSMGAAGINDHVHSLSLYVVRCVAKMALAGESLT
jgi:hypothetical protein